MHCFVDLHQVRQCSCTWGGSEIIKFRLHQSGDSGGVALSRPSAALSQSITFIITNSYNPMSKGTFQRQPPLAIVLSKFMKTMRTKKSTTKKPRKPDMDTWLESETPHLRTALERASRHFDRNDALDVHTLEAMYGKESSFGRSRGKRNSEFPAGDFQIDPSLARKNGLRVSERNDERFDLDASSAAAAKILKHSDNLFSKRSQISGDRYTSPISDPIERKRFDLAAYHAGDARIAKAQALAKQAGEDPTKWENVQKYLEAAGEKAKLADQTREYVHTVSGYEREFVKKSKADANAKYKKGKPVDPYPKGGHWVTINHRHIFIEDKKRSIS